MEITLHIPVIFPDTTTILTSVKESRGIFKDGNCPHPFRILPKEFYRIFVRKQILKQILKQRAVFY
jgi:hypothetical protein